MRNALRMSELCFTCVFCGSVACLKDSSWHSLNLGNRRKNLQINHGCLRPNSAIDRVGERRRYIRRQGCKKVDFFIFLNIDASRHIFRTIKSGIFTNSMERHKEYLAKIKRKVRP